ncbi:hypothetical protein [Soonwooa sp.]|uniref:hypothetical protein n=1 Tax=Soonwooa sp. TaxID=1938592 RepID=UPI00289876C4|nr:hypothetical protein [Soonwooa sp.]
MGNIIVGLMSQQNDYQNLRFELEESGFRDSDYIIYLNNGENDSFWASISANNDQQKNKGEEILKKLDAKKSYYFKNVDIEDAKSFDALKKEIGIRAKSEIHPSPDIRHRTPHHGLNSEIKF